MDRVMKVPLADLERDPVLQMTQKAIAAREGCSEGTVSSHVRAGTLISPDRIRAAGLELQEVGALGITKLTSIINGPEEGLEARLVQAVRPEEPTEPTQSQSFEWRERANGSMQAILRRTDVAAWSSQERRAAVDHLGPVVSGARREEGIEDPELASLRARLTAEHREALLEMREEMGERMTELLELCHDLLVEPGSRGGRAGHVASAPGGRGRPSDRSGTGWWPGSALIQ